MMELVDFIRRARLNLATEKQAQADLETLLVAHFDPVLREHRLGPGDIVDFFVCGDIVVELKAARASKPGILGQLRRYAAYPHVRGLILASNTAVVLPSTLLGKPVVFISLGQVWL